MALMTGAIVVLTWHGFATGAAGLVVCLGIGVMPWVALWARSAAGRREAANRGDTGDTIPARRPLGESA